MLVDSHFQVPSKDAWFQGSGSQITELSARLGGELSVSGPEPFGPGKTSYFALLNCPFTLTYFPVSATDTHANRVMLPPPCFLVRVVLGKWEASGCIHIWHLELPSKNEVSVSTDQRIVFLSRNSQISGVLQWSFLFFNSVKSDVSHRRPLDWPLINLFWWSNPRRLVAVPNFLCSEWWDHTLQQSFGFLKPEP